MKEEFKFVGESHLFTMAPREQVPFYVNFQGGAKLTLNPDGSATFEGDADDAAQQFFNGVIKLHNQQYKQPERVFAGGTEQRRASKEVLEMYLKEPDCHVAKWMAIELLERRHDEKAFNGTVTAQTAEALKLSGEDLKALQGRVEGELKPFMYGIADPDGAAHFGEFCVSSDAAHVEDEVHQLNEQCTEDGEPLYKVVPLYRLPELEKEGE